MPVVIAPAGTGLDALSPSFGDGTRRRSALGVDDIAACRPRQGRPEEALVVQKIRRTDYFAVALIEIVIFEPDRLWKLSLTLCFQHTDLDASRYG